MVDLVVYLKVALIAGAAVNLTVLEISVLLSISTIDFKMTLNLANQHNELNSNTRLCVAHICNV